MPFSAEVIRIKGHNEDHEVGGLDLPAAVTLATALQHTAAAVEMVAEGVGAFSAIGAFNVRAISPGPFQFSTFGNVALGQYFVGAEKFSKALIRKVFLTKKRS